MTDRTQIGIRIDSSLLAQLDDWADAQPIVPTRTATIEGLIRAHLAEHAAEAECAYCSATVPRDEGVPDADDHDAWAEFAQHHDDNCEWVSTRAHRLTLRTA